MIITVLSASLCTRFLPFLLRLRPLSCGCPPLCRDTNIRILLSSALAQGPSCWYQDQRAPPISAPGSVSVDLSLRRRSTIGPGTEIAAR
jgi:hypothetical protein